MERTRYTNEDAYVYDPLVRGADTDFFATDSGAGLTFDTARNALNIGDTGAAPASASSYSQYLFGDFEFAMLMDSTVPDSSDSERYFGLRNPSDSLQRGAAYFDLSYDTTAGDSSPNARPFAAVAYDEQGNRRRTHITWDTDWSGGARVARFRLKWDENGYSFLVNDSVVATFEGGERAGDTYVSVNASIPQHLRIVRRSSDTTTGAPTALRSLIIRNARKVSGRQD